MTSWQIIHTRFPELCEGSRKVKGSGCTCWIKQRGVCSKIYMENGECNYSLERAIEKQKTILKGEI